MPRLSDSGRDFLEQSVAIVNHLPVNDHDGLRSSTKTITIPDADDTLPGHQVDFSSDVPEIRVVSEDGRATNTYTIAEVSDTAIGVIDRDEAVNAIVDYFDANLRGTSVMLYFSS